MAKFKKLALLFTAILVSSSMAIFSACVDIDSIDSSSSSSMTDAVTYSVKFVNEDGTVLQEGAVEEGQLPVYSGETPAKAGDAQYSYEFDGWDKPVVEASADAVYTAKYRAVINNYTVAFDTDGGSAVEAQTVPYGTSADALADFSSTKTGYTFAGWTMEDGSAIPEDATVTENITVKASWEVITYSAKVIRADEREETVEFTIENRAEKLAAIVLTPNNAQYTYSWESELPSELALNNEQIFTEIETINNYTLTFDTDGGSTVEAIVVPYGTPANALEQITTTKEGYQFVKWQVLYGENYIDIPEGSIVECDMTIKAIWIKEYAVKYFSFDGVELNSITVLEGDKLTTVYAPDLYNATFEGWYNGEEAWDFEEDIVNEDTNLYAKYSRIEATATEFE
ncbi:MAG: InlB B-repeat-containing protein, partial [Clostridia bacterium]|nr:InlB B-repeat-containing protein [Clostridia bacterium]